MSNEDKSFWSLSALIYVLFFSLIGTAIYFTKSPIPLWALLATPTMSSKNTKDKDEVK